MWCSVADFSAATECVVFSNCAASNTLWWRTRYLQGVVTWSVVLLIDADHGKSAMTWLRSNLVGLKLFQNLDQQTELRLAMIFYVLYNHFAIARGSMLSAACLGLRLQAGTKAVSSE